MSFITVEGLGPLVHLSRALGLVVGDNLQPSWFQDPGLHLSRMLREPAQREALLAALDELIAQGESVPTDVRGRRWLRIAEVDPVGVFAVLHVLPSGEVELGVGAQVRANDPACAVDAYVPLFLVPQGSAPVSVVVGSGAGRAELSASVDLAAPGEAAPITGVGLRAEIPTGPGPGDPPALVVVLRGLKLSGDAAREDVEVGASSAAALEESALRLVGALLRQAASTAAAQASALLGLLGLGGDAAIPPLPIPALLDEGIPALQRWVEALVATPGALAAWLRKLGDLVAASVPAARAPAVAGDRVTWTLASGAEAGLIVRAAPGAGGAASLELGGFARVAPAGPNPPGAATLEVVGVRVTVGPAPAAVGLPSLSLSVRLGPDPGAGGAAPLVAAIAVGPVSVEVRSLRVGLVLDETRSPRLVLAAEDVRITTGARAVAYPVLDLTRADALADVGGAVVDDIAADLLARLGPAGAAVRAALGLEAPLGGAWPVPLVSAVDLLARPLDRVLEYHRQVLADFPAGYGRLLSAMAGLLAPAGAPAPTGAGTESDPWKAALAEGLSFAAWRDGAGAGTLHLGVAIDRAIADLGGSCPTVAVGFLAELVRVDLGALRGRALGLMDATVLFGARGGVPLRVGTDEAALVADRIGLRLRLLDGRLTASLVAPGLAGELDGEPLPFALPQVDAGGDWVSAVPWRALERLAGMVLLRAGPVWARELAELLGWASGPAGRLSLEALVQDPLAAAADLLGRLPAERVLRLATLVFTGPAAGDLPVGVFRGLGDRDTPFAIPLAARGEIGAQPFAFVSLSGLTRPLRLGAFRPPDLTALVMGAAPPLPFEVLGGRLAGMLAVAGGEGRIAHDALRGRTELGTGLATLAERFAGGDGLVGAADAAFPGATVHEVEAGHAALPALDLAVLTGAPADAQTLLVTLDAGWPGSDEARTVDLSAPGLPPAAFDLGPLASLDGPWVIRLPSRRDAPSAAGEDPSAAQAARLARAVEAVAARAVAAGAAPAVKLVAHGAAGHAARQVAATAAGVARLVTLGTPHGGIDLSVLDGGGAADALQLLAALVPPPGPRPEVPSALLGRDLVAPLLAAYRAGDRALEDLAPPPGAPPALPAAVEAHAVVGRAGAAGAQAALAALVARALQEAFEAEEAARRTAERAAPAMELPRLGIGRRWEAGDPVRIGAEVRLELCDAGTAVLDPVLVARIELSRPGAFLAGGPDPTRPAGALRDPSVRRAELELSIPLRRPAEAGARAVLHEAEALGIRRLRWEIARPSQGVAALDAGARLLLGRAFAALGPLPTAGPERELADALAALDLLSSAPATGATVGLSVDGVEHLLADPAGFVAAVRARRGGPAFAAALARLLGAPPPDAAAPARVVASTDGVSLMVDAATGRVELSAADIRLHSGLALSGALALEAASAAGTLTVASPSGLALEISGPPLVVRVRAGSAGALAAPAALYPAPDAAALALLLVAAAPAQVLWAGVTFVRTIDPRVNALLDPVLDALGLLAGERVRIPLALLSAPRAWLEEAAALGGARGVDPDRLIAAVGAVGALTGLAGATPGVLSLPAGFEIAAERTAAGGARLALRAGGSPGGDLRVKGGVTLDLPAPGAGPLLGLEAVLALGGAGAIESASRLRARVSPSGGSLALVLASGSELSLLPPGPGLAASAASAAATYALPLALDAVVARGAVPGDALAVLGTALGLRPAGTFDGNQILALAGDPAAQLAARLTAGAAAALPALADLVRPALPAPWTASAAGGALTVARPGAVSVSVRAPSSARVALSVSAGPITVFPGAAVDGEIALSDAGLRRLRARFQLDPAQPLQAGPLSLAPGAEIDVGVDATDGPHAAVWLAAGAARLEGRLAFGNPATFDLRAPGAPSLPVGAALVLVPLAADLALSLAEVQAILATPVLASGGVPGIPVRTLLDGVLLRAAGASFDPGVLDPAQLLPRALSLAGKLAGQLPAIPAGPLAIRIGPRPDDAQRLGVTLTLAEGERFVLADGDVQVALEVDATWIAPPGNGGIRLDLLRVGAAGVSIEPGFEIRGLGVRVLRKEKPLVDAQVTIGSLALFGYVSVDARGVVAGGGQIEVGALALPLGGGDGGDKVASGILEDASSGSQRPQAAFSPALSLQVGPPPRGLQVGFRAGPGEGPWWLPIQRGFGPVWIEQVGLGVEKGSQGPRAVSVLIDGRVSLLGFTVGVDDLSLTADLTKPLYEPSAWSASLAGLSVGADTGGVKIAGGLRRGSGAPDYLGMLTVRFSVYGITAFGGYAVKTDEQGEYTSFFLFGSLLAPIGGVPAFFVTGIGAGVGVNRKLILPDLTDFTIFPLVAALDRNSAAAASPDRALEEMQRAFPAGRGRFWLAAGISFTCFTLIEGIAVVAVEIGDGLQIALLGLLRAALPRPEAVLVSVELALLARFSTRDGILWIQGQLTENSWLLTRDCRLTGGFAHVMWFKGEHAGEFVITLGGFHPSFRREGYPVVPRLGFVWNVADALVIKGESYFALTSEAIMAGTRFEARLDAGLLWAYLRLGADGIVYFDPFWFQVSAFAEMGAGITIDIDLGWFGHIRITVSVRLSADVVLEGPAFRGRARIDLDVATAEIAFGEWSGSKPPDLLWPAFRRKYLVQSDDPAEATRVLAVTPGRGQVPDTPGGSAKPPTGGERDPFRLAPEFSLEVRTKAAASDLLAAGTAAPPRVTGLAVAPMGRPGVTSRLTAALLDDAGADRIDQLAATPVRDRFPKGVWAARPDPQTVPEGELVEAYAGWTLVADPRVVGVTPEIDYRQVQTGERKPLPFAAESAARPAWRAEVGAAASVAELLPGDSAGAFALAERWKADGPRGQRDRFAAERRRPARRAPPQLVPLAAGTTAGPFEHTPAPPPAAPPAPVELPWPEPRLEARLVLPPSAIEPGRARVTVAAGHARGVRAAAPPDPAALRAASAAGHGARLVLRSPAAAAREATIVAAHVPVTTRAGSGLEGRRAGSRMAHEKLAKGFRGAGVALAAGELHVYRLPGAEVPRVAPAGGPAARAGAVELDGPARVVFFAPMGVHLGSAYVEKGRVPVPAGAERFAVLPGAAAGERGVGWHAGTVLAQVGASAYVGPGCALRASAGTTWRAGQAVRQALVHAGDVVGGFSRVETTLERPVRAVTVILEPTEPGASAEDVQLELRGATRRPGAVPRLVVAAGRTAAVYDLESDERADTVEVIVTTTASMRLAGVVGTGEDAAALAARVAERGLDQLLEPLARPAPRVRARWIAPRGPRPGLSALRGGGRR